MARVIISIGGKTLRESVIPRDAEFTIGRDSDNMLQLDNPGVSRYHARIRREGWPFYIEDLGSTNGTKINGKPIPQKASLKKGDKIGISKFTILFMDDPSDYDEQRKGKGDGMTTIPVG